MAEKPNNPDAFPNDHTSEICRGMTLRDYFAAAALQGILANEGRLDNQDHGEAEAAYSFADKMLEERSK